MYDQYDALIFDMDGTILDTEPTHRKAWRQVLTRYGLTLDEARIIDFNGAPTCGCRSSSLNPISRHSTLIFLPQKKPLL